MAYTHDHMILAIKALYPGTLHGRDFIVMHPVDNEGNQTGKPFIAVWRHVEPQPKDADIHAYFDKNRTDLCCQYVRKQRDARLKHSDRFAAVPADAPAAVQATASKWVAYRAALRDITKQPGFPHDVQWPSYPA